MNFVFMSGIAVYFIRIFAVQKNTSVDQAVIGSVLQRYF